MRLTGDGDVHSVFDTAIAKMRQHDAAYGGAEMSFNSAQELKNEGHISKVQKQIF